MAADLFALLSGRRGHFCMESEYHCELWFDLDRLFDDETTLAPFVDELAAKLARYQADAVCGPASGGAKLATLIGTRLGIPAFHAERVESAGASGLFPIRYLIPSSHRDRLRDRRVVLADDAISAGSAVKGTHADLLACGANPVACGALAIFGDAADGIARANHLALESVTRMPFAMWKPADCPLCRGGSPLEKISSDTSSAKIRQG